jgi:hypothetical protein
MPKLSQQTLEKRFLCTNCGQTFRTRQGLSGHIQYKHKPGTTEEKTFSLMPINAFKLKNHAELAGFNEEEISQIGKIWVDWQQIKGVLEGAVDIKFNGSDFKTYLIASLSQIQANRWLLNKVQKYLDDGISGMLKIQNDMASTILSKSKIL